MNSHNSRPDWKDVPSRIPQQRSAFGSFDQVPIGSILFSQIDIDSFKGTHIFCEPNPRVELEFKMIKSPNCAHAEIVSKNILDGFNVVLDETPPPDIIKMVKYLDSGHPIVFHDGALEDFFKSYGVKLL